MSGSGRALVVGLAVTGEAVTRRLRREGWQVVVAEDAPGGEAYAGRAETVRAAGADLIEVPTADAVADLARGSDLVVPSPLVTEEHPAVSGARAAGVPIRSEIDLAAERAHAPIVAVTGTNGKTTVTTLTTAILEASDRRASSAGNIGRTLIDAVDDDVDVLVAEVSSFQLAFTTVFRPRVAVLLAIAPDHLDWHGSFEHYRASKARIFEQQRDDDLLVYDADDIVSAQTAAAAPARRIGVTLGHNDEMFHVADNMLVTADGHELIALADMRRALPHDRTNALAAAAAALAVGANASGARRAIASYATLPHRVALVGEARGVQYYDDSKATNPHAALHAVSAFESVVLIAGGRNKGLDLSVLADAAPHIRAVVAIGEAAPEVVQAFESVRPVVSVVSMRDAVRAAAEHALPGDVVLLSPGCASFDAYANYAARGDDFAVEVHALVDTEAPR